MILDHVGNTLRLGHHLEDREWTLDGKKKKDVERVPSVKVCPMCFAAMASQISVCQQCGHEFVAEKRELEVVPGELQVLSAEQAKELAEIMEQAVPLQVPNKCDVEVGPSWGECKDLDNG